jgi:hypothetical protein
MLTLVVTLVIFSVVFIFWGGAWLSHWLKDRHGHVAYGRRWVCRWVVFLVVFVVAAGLFVAINVTFYDYPPVEGSMSVSEAELAEGKVVDAYVVEGSANPCDDGRILSNTWLCVDSLSRGSSVEDASVNINGVSFHLGESEEVEDLGRVTLLAFENHGGGQYVRLLVVPDEFSTWLVVKSANIPQSVLDEGDVVDVRFDQPTYVGELSMSVSAVFVDPRFGEGNTGTVVVGFSRDYPLDDVSVSLRLGESKHVDGVGTVTLVAFEDLDWDQGFKLLIVPYDTGADADTDIGSGV